MSQECARIPAKEDYRLPNEVADGDRSVPLGKMLKICSGKVETLKRLDWVGFLQRACMFYGRYDNDSFDCKNFDRGGFL